jgi:hypothetical protein
MSNEDSQFIETRQFSVREVAAALKIPPHMLGDDTKTSFASLEQENQRYLDTGIDPWLREIEVAASDKLLTLQEWQGSVTIEFVRQAFVRTDLAARSDAYNTAIMAGYMSRADVRRLENMNVDDPELEKYLQPLNMVPAGEQQDSTTSTAATTSSPAGASPQEDQEAARAALLRTTQHQAGQLVNRIAKDAQRAAKQPRKWIAWLDRMEADHGEVFIRDFAQICGQDKAQQVVRAFFTKIRQDLLEAAECGPAQLPEVIRQLMATARQDLPGELAKEVMQAWQIHAGAA